MMLIHAAFIFLCSISFSNAALPACGSTGCPVGGMWTEWVITGSPKCTTPCGSCSSLYYSRRCLSERAGCKCTGNSTFYVPCNTNVCLYPTQKACCKPYVPMVIDGSYICGPIPIARSSSGTTSCCPTGGLYSEWSKYGRNDANTLWIRTRECLSADVGCGCTQSLIETSSSCPCPKRMNNLKANGNCNTPDYQMDVYDNIVIDDAKCEATFNMQATNYINAGNSDKVIYCNHFQQYTTKGAPMILFEIAPGETKAQTCALDRPFDCSFIKTPETNHDTIPVSFTCDLETNTWQYDYNGWHVTGYNQPRLLYT